MAGSPSTDAAASNRAFWALCALVVAVGLWNAAHYPPGAGYDALDHIDYADGLVPGWKLPQGVGEYYTPPGFYLVAGAGVWVADRLGLGEPHRAAAALNVLFLLAALAILL